MHDDEPVEGTTLQQENARIISAWSEARPGVEAFGPQGDFGRRHLLNPAIFGLLGDVRGKAILDAGCGQGYLCRLLAERGARVVGAEPAATLLADAIAHERATPLGVVYRSDDLSQLGNDLANRFDVVIANMVLMDIPDYESAMRHCVSSLRTGGTYIFSLLHPCFEEPSAAWVERGYVSVREYLNPYVTPVGPMAVYHRPLSAYINHTIHLGCAIQALIEPQLSLEAAQADPKYERNCHVPSFIVIAATKV